MNMQNQHRFNNFDSLLEWLDSNRERAAEKYEEIRESLIQIFTWRRCSDAESLADETLDRVMLRVPELRGTYKGNPSTYILAVAKKVLAEHARTRRVQEADSAPENLRTTNAENEKMYGCMERCLSKLSPLSRDLIELYYTGERTRQSSLKDLSEKFRISPNSLRLRIHRIRSTLQTCIQACMEQQGTV